MASGWGITGNKGRCYDFWVDFSECMSGCREPKDCAFLREDYLECLHHTKEVLPFSNPPYTPNTLRKFLMIRADSEEVFLLGAYYVKNSINLLATLLKVQGTRHKAQGTGIHLGKVSK
ncbi:hypothetical protein Cni_G24532 [Canna indica]|uniref:Uncharacterized protein n=1 Tax=Canna indica TaxID=4628 RepID=A0AAQ3QNJ1_9LILI|nr:hypothetical protein Cni_G24532 [Canna indica]